MKAPEQIETTRLILRQPHLSDAVTIFERYASDPEVTQFLGWPRHRTIRDTEAFLQFSAAEWEHWPAGPYLITSRSDGRLIGGTGFGFCAPREAVTGYVLAKDEWGMGYATEALTAVRCCCSDRRQAIAGALPSGPSPIATRSREVRVRPRRHGDAAGGVSQLGSRRSARCHLLCSGSQDAGESHGLTRYLAAHGDLRDDEPPRLKPGRYAARQYELISSNSGSIIGLG
jgi:hypothetical protein